MADFHRLQGKRFLIIGRAGMDLYADPPGTLTEDATRFTACLGGSSANIAVALVKQGAQADLVTCVSDDAIGRFCLNQLDSYGVGRRYVRIVGGEARNSLGLVETRNQNTQSVIYRNNAADFAMAEPDVAELDYAAYSALITTGTVLAAEPSRSATFQAFELARAAGLPLIFDIDYRPYSWQSTAVATEIYSRAAALCDIVVGNDLEFGFMAGSYELGLEKARALAEDGAAVAIYKLGEKGAITFTAGEDIRTGIYRSQTLKPTGAGDAFLGGFISGIADGRSVHDAVMRGSAAAAIVVTRVGCAPSMPTAAELDVFIGGHLGPTEFESA